MPPPPPPEPENLLEPTEPFGPAGTANRPGEPTGAEAAAESAPGEGSEMSGNVEDMIEEGLMAPQDDLCLVVTNFVVQYAGVDESVQTHFASEYTCISGESQVGRRTFEHIAQLINGVRAVAPSSDADPKLADAHKQRAALLVTVLQGIIDRCRGVELRFDIMEDFGTITAPLAAETETGLEGMPPRSLSRTPSKRGRRDKRKMGCSYLLERLDRHVGGWWRRAQEAKEKEEKKKKKKEQPGVTQRQAERLADCLGACQHRLREDMMIPEKLLQTFLSEGGSGELLGMEVTAKYKRLGACGYAAELVRRAQEGDGSAFREFFDFVKVFSGDLKAVRASDYHHPRFVEMLEVQWTSEKVDEALQSVISTEKERRANAQQIKRDVLRATQEAGKECTSAAGAVDLKLMEQVLALL